MPPCSDLPPLPAGRRRRHRLPISARAPSPLPPRLLPAPPTVASLRPAAPVARSQPDPPAVRPLPPFLSISPFLCVMSLMYSPPPVSFLASCNACSWNRVLHCDWLWICSLPLDLAEFPRICWVRSFPALDVASAGACGGFTYGPLGEGYLVP